MRRGKTRTPELEGLESLTLLSTGPQLVSAAAAQVVRARPVTPATATTLRLAGTLRGNYSVPIRLGVAPKFQIQGSGAVGGLGTVRMTGEATSASSPDSMDIVLSNRRGSVTLRLGPNSGEATASQKVPFTIASGTGAYAKATGQGTAEMIVMPRSATGLDGRVSLILRPGG